MMSCQTRSCSIWTVPGSFPLARSAPAAFASDCPQAALWLPWLPLILHHQFVNVLAAWRLAYQLPYVCVWMCCDARRVGQRRSFVGTSHFIMSKHCKLLQSGYCDNILIYCAALVNAVDNINCQEWVILPCLEFRIGQALEETSINGVSVVQPFFLQLLCLSLIWTLVLCMYGCHLLLRVLENVHFYCLAVFLTTFHAERNEFESSQCFNGSQCLSSEVWTQHYSPCGTWSSNYTLKNVVGWYLYVNLVNQGT